MKPATAFEVLRTLDPSPPVVVTTEEIDDRLDEILVTATRAADNEGALAAQPTPPIHGAVRRHRTTPLQKVVLAAAAALVLVAGTLAAISLTSGSSPARHGMPSQRRATSAAPARPAAPKWSLAASLVGQQYQIATGNPASVVGVVCSSGTTCLLSTGYGLDYGGGGGMFASHDGGQTWQASPLPQNMAITSLASCVSDTWCAAGGGLLDPATGDPAADKPMRDPELMVTTDGGTTWTAQAVPLPVDVQQLPAYGSLPAETTYWPGGVDDVSCSAVNVCNVLGQTQVNTGNGGFELIFLHTDDGGATWTSRVLPAVPGVSNYQLVLANGQSESMSCATAHDCTVVAHFVSPQTGEAWSTHDGGATWTTTAVPDVAQVDPSLSCPTVHVCWTGPITVSTDSEADMGTEELLESDDGGSSWSAVTLPSFAPRPSSAIGGLAPDVSCTAADECAVTLDGGIATTTDGGASWQEAVLPATVGGVIQVSCGTGGSCVAIADPAQGATPDPFNGGSMILTDDASAG